MPPKAVLHVHTVHLPGAAAAAATEVHLPEAAAAEATVVADHQDQEVSAPEVHPREADPLPLPLHPEEDAKPEILRYTDNLKFYTNEKIHKVNNHNDARAVFS